VSVPFSGVNIGLTINIGAEIGIGLGLGVALDNRDRIRKGQESAGDSSLKSTLYKDSR
jgi:hypothetical protein